MSYLPINPPTSLRDRMLEARDRPAVIKLKLANYRSRQPGVTLLAFEGPEDKTIYAQWVKRIREDLRYEPFVCGGKTAVLNLAEVVARDVAGDAARVYCFVDRDYDDLRGTPPHPRVFMTPTYSVENLLVNEGVLESLLINEFHCEGNVSARSAILALFSFVYESFLKLSQEFNFRLFVARRSGIFPSRAVPDKLSEAISISLDEVSLRGVEVEKIIVYGFQPAKEDLEKFKAEFQQLNPRERYRGKWALTFFEAWLRHLIAERREAKLGLFSDFESSAKIRVPELVQSNFAARSALPLGLPDFLSSVEQA